MSTPSYGREAELAEKEFLGFGYALLALWFMVLLAVAVSERPNHDPTEARETKRPRSVLIEFYWELILPVVTGSALFGLLQKDPGFQSLEWWGAIFFVLYFSIQHTRRPRPGAYRPLGFLLDTIGIAVFYYVMDKIGLFNTASRCLNHHSSILFLGVLSVPLLGGLARLCSGRIPRFVLTSIALVAATLGYIGSLRNWAVSFQGCMMALLLSIGLLYFVGNIIEDGGRVSSDHWWLR